MSHSIISSPTSSKRKDIVPWDPCLQRLITDCFTPNNDNRSRSNTNANTAATASTPYYLQHDEETLPLDDSSYSWPPFHPTHNNVTNDCNIQEEREQALRDYKVTIEYKHLKSHAPGGVYLIPSLNDLRHFYGVIFVRRGPFTNGIFKFELKLPPQYNDIDTHPEITFTSYVFNPYVNETTGQLELKSAYPTWDPAKHYLVTVLTFLKKIFYAKSFEDATANPKARDLQQQDPAQYRKQVDACVRKSQKEVYDNSSSVAKFTEEQLSHRVLRDLLKANVKEPAAVSKNALLSMISKASHV